MRLVFCFVKSLILQEATMTKADLVSKIAKDAGISQKAADMVLKTFVGAIHESLKGPEEQIRIPDLGTFKVSQRKARTGVNPRTREKIEIPAGRAPGFTAAKALKEAVK
jgi:nucleoid DNA-binding protein